MKPKQIVGKRRSFFRQSLRLCVALSAFSFYSYSAQATAYYWDETNDGTATFGTAGTVATPWSSTGSLFSTDVTGAATVTGTVVTTTADGANFGADATHVLGAGTITVSGTVTVGTIDYRVGTTGIILSGGTIQGNGNVSNAAAGSETINSNLDLNAGTRAIGNTLTNGSLTLGGVVSNGTLIVARQGTVTITGANTFTTNVQIGNTNAQSATAIVSTIGNQGVASPLGMGTSVIIGGAASASNTGNTGTLQYTGAGETSNRLIALSSTFANTNAAITNNGTGTLTLTGTITSSGVNRTLTLRGTGAGVASGVISDGTTTMALTKNDAGTWTLSGANTYKGLTTVTAGMLTVASTGSLGTGNVTLANTAGVVLQLNNTTAIADSAVLTFGASSAIQMNGTGSETLGAITNSTSGTTLSAVGTYNAAALNSFFGVTSFSGNETITLTGVPEPSTLVCELFAFGLAAGILLRRRSSAKIRRQQA